MANQLPRDYWNVHKKFATKELDALTVEQEKEIINNPTAALRFDEKVKTLVDEYYAGQSLTV